jgi:DNA-binding transcriptional LysR family regulator
MSAHWDDLKTVMHLVRGGSLASAAEALGVSYTTVARRVKRAEDDLGLQLFERLADGYQATDAGHVVARKAAAMETEEHDLMRNLLGADQKLSGTLTITAPQLLCATHLAPVFEAFTAQYPDVDLQVRAANELLDLNRREADLAIRISNDPGDSLMGLRLTEQHAASFASPEWAEKIETNPKVCIDWVVYHKLAKIPKASLEKYPNARVRMMFDDMVSMIGAARAGAGVVRMPMFLGRHYPDLVQVPVLEPQPYSDIWVVSHRDVWPSARVAAFRQLLVPHFRANKDKFTV